VQSSTPKFGNSSPEGWRSGRSGTSEINRHRAVAGFGGFAKRAIDVVFALAGLIALSPLLVVIALAIRLSDGGPAFSRQIRVGLDRRRFTMIKFRTMRRDAERDLGAIWSVPGDPRCTPIGTYLRPSGFDELPQLWNVLRGQMSLVGPRPERPEFTREFRKEHSNYDVRHNVRPGITGYAQIYGWRGYTSLEERLRHDIYYVSHWSLWLDVRILAMTLVRGWSQRTRDGVGEL
jgi:putative colanic acid biosynthesis UDP-glucose lipid carrier transferase